MLLLAVVPGFTDTKLAVQGYISICLSEATIFSIESRLFPIVFSGAPVGAMRRKIIVLGDSTL